MDDEILKKEGKDEEGTSPSEPQPAPELNSSPEPTAEQAEEAGVTPASDPVKKEEGAPAETAQEQQQPAERTFTQKEVNDLVGRTRIETREQTFKAVYGRYGVSDEQGMDELVGNAQRYETARGEFDSQRAAWEKADADKARELSGVKEQIALLESGIDRSRFDDARAIIRSKGMEVTPDSIAAELATHPEWKGAGAGEAKKESRIEVLGNEGALPPDGMSEEDYVMKNIFKF